MRRLRITSIWMLIFAAVLIGAGCGGNRTKTTASGGTGDQSKSTSGGDEGTRSKSTTDKKTPKEGNRATDAGGQKGAPEGPKLYPVKGKLTVAGNVAAGVRLMLVPVDPAYNPIATGLCLEDGTFALTSGTEGNVGAAAGKYKIVLLQLGSAPPAEQIEAGRITDASKPPFNAKYLTAPTSDKEVTVEPKSNSLAIDVDAAGNEPDSTSAAESGSGTINGRRLYLVQGTLLVDGRPPKDVVVQLIPVEPIDNPVAAGRCDAEGKFTVLSGREGKKGAVAGKYKVVLVQVGQSVEDYARALEERARKRDLFPPPLEGPKPTFHSKYLQAATSDKEVFVEAKSNRIRFDVDGPEK